MGTALDVNLMERQTDIEDPLGLGPGSMLGVPVTARPSPPPRVEHVQGMEALPRVIEILTRLEPAVLLTADGRGALYAPASDGDDPAGRFWLLADARTALDWEGDRRQELTLTFQSRDERVYLQISGLAQVVTEPGVAGALWRHSFQRWFPGGPADPRLLLVLFTASSAEFYESAAGRVSAHVPH